MASGRNIVNFIRNIAKTRTFDRVLAGLSLVEAEPGRCVCELTVGEEHTNSLGTLHGGFTATLVDSVSTEVLAATPPGVRGATVDLNISYLRPVKQGEAILIEAKTLKLGQTLAFLSVDITRKTDGALVAQGQHTKFVGTADGKKAENL